MSLIPQQQQYDPRYQNQGHLPFQQINPHQGMQPGSAEAILQQRINDRNNMDLAYGGRPMQPQMQSQMQGQGQMPMPGPGQMPIPMQPVAGMANAHPAVIQRFLNMDPDSQQRFAQMYPQLYQQICNTIARQQQQQQPQQPPQQPQDDNASTISSSSIDTPNSQSSDLENSHSSDDENKELKMKKKDKKNMKKSTRPTAKLSTRPSKSTKSKASEPAQSRSLRVKHSTRTNQNVQIHGQGLFLSLDFRNDLVEINNDCYVLGFPMQHNVSSIELKSCLINRNPVLEREPYIYIAIGEVSGDYQVTAGHQTHHVFGKLIQEKTVNEFIVYTPENCIKLLDRPARIDQLSITFLKYDMTPIPLNRLLVEKLSRAKDYLKVTTKAQHYLSVGDRVNISQSHGDLVSVDMVDVIKVIRPDIVALENPINNISRGSSLQFEKVDLKCTLTFQLHSS